MLGPIARTTAVLPLAVAHIACSHTLETAADDPYANCVDLGELSLRSYSRPDAEQRMRVRVLELGGDTLLFGVRGRTDQLSASPDEIVERRNELLAPAANVDEQPAVLTPEEVDAAFEAAEAAADQRRGMPIATTQTETSPRELWFYGAALRCNSRDSSR